MTALRTPRGPLARRSLFAGAGALLGGALLSACSEESLPPEVPTSGSLEQPTPAAGKEQLDAVLAEVADALKAADEKLDAALLKPRIVGTAAAHRTRTYEIIELDEEWKSQLTRPSGTSIEVMTSTSTDFPRQAITLVEASESGEAPYFMALQQKDVASPYATWGWAQQMIDVDMPSVPAASMGSEPVTLETEDLLRTPVDALNLYCSVLSSGDGTDEEDVLAPNPFQTETHEAIAAERKELTAGLESGEEAPATIHEKYSLKKDEFTGLRTDDGGAVVMAVLDSTRTLKVTDGATVRYAEDNIFTTLAESKEFTKEYSRTFGTIVALYIPPQDSDAKIQPIAASRTLLDASGS